MADTGIFKLIRATRAMLIESPELSAAGVFFGRATRETKLPYVILSVIPHRADKSFDPNRDHFRNYTVQLRTCAATQGGYEAGAIAEPLVAAIHERFTKQLSGGTPQGRLNAHLNPLGWTAAVPVEGTEVTPYPDYIGDLERWNFVNRYDLRISVLEN